MQPGDFVSVAIDSLENGYGDTILSRDRAKRLSAWLQLEKALENGELVTGTITGKVKGGLTVMTNGIRAFLPGSLVDLRPVKDTTRTKARPSNSRSSSSTASATTSCCRVARCWKPAWAKSARSCSKPCTKVLWSRAWSRTSPTGAFVDLGGIDGLLHITDMAWRRVRHPSEVLQVGQEVEAKVLKFDQEKSRVSLGVKQLGEDPWVGLARRYPQGTRLFGKVTNLTDYGAFVEVEAGIEGLVHVSEMDWTNKNVDPRKVVTLGEEVEVMVLEIDEDRRRISLGMKQCRQNPWEEFATNFKRGDKVRGAIKSITDFGVFVGLPGGIDGLVHLSDLSWTETGEEAVRNFKKGDEIEAVVLGIDTDKERISLGIKQLEGDPFNNFVATYDKGAVVPGTIKSVEAKGAVITLSVDVEGYLRASEISSGRVEDATTVLKAGENIEAMIVNIDRKTRSIQLSIKARDNAETAETIQRMSEASASSGTTNLARAAQGQAGPTAQRRLIRDQVGADRRPGGPLSSAGPGHRLRGQDRA